MKSILITIGVMLFFDIAGAQKLEKLWEVSSLDAPESVVFYPEKNAYIVSNVAGQPAEKNGLGYLSLVSTDGKILKQKWVTGFEAPKGLGIYNDKLYVADIDQVVEVNLKTASIEKKHQAIGATFLNDVEIATDGTVYITDTFGGNAIYQIKDEKIAVWMKSAQLDYPNGLKINGDNLYVSTWGVVTDPATFGTEVPGRLLAVNLRTQKVTEVTKSIGNLDGLLSHETGFLTTDWVAGSLMFVEKSGKTSIVKDLNSGSADIGFGNQPDILLIPQMMDGVLAAYQLK